MLKALFLLLKFAKLGKVAMSGGSMLLSILVYGSLYGWVYGVGLVMLLFVHELGHYAAARQRGLAVGLPAFIPFVGAWVALKDRIPNAETEAYVGIAGPAAGTLGAVACYFLAGDGNKTLLAISYAGFMINLFNLLPISPLDGGRITTVLSPRIWLLGVPLLVGLYFLQHSPILLIIGILGIPKAWAAWQGRLDEAPEYWQVSMADRISYGAMYIALVAGLALISYDLHRQLSGG
ncbi:MAG TPA: site-2 protease family protein [Candidatus Acidoferrum sp.]|nr:site-2 protease family protein [Candidatus Acidoferrum sp.]